MQELRADGQGKRGYINLKPLKPHLLQSRLCGENLIKTLLLVH
jgi:hypothetical protein